MNGTVTAVQTTYVYVSKWFSRRRFKVSVVGTDLCRHNNNNALLQSWQTQQLTIIVGLATTEQQAATQYSNCIIELKERHAGLKYN